MLGQVMNLGSNLGYGGDSLPVGYGSGPTKVEFGHGPCNVTLQFMKST